MKSNLPHRISLPSFHIPAEVYPVSVSVLLLLTCPEQSLGANRTDHSAAPPEPQLLLPPGHIGVMAIAQPARWSCDPPRGQTSVPGDAAQSSAVATLNWPAAATNPEDILLLSVVGTVAAPVSAAVSGLNASLERLPATKLHAVNTSFAATQARLAQPEHLAAALLATPATAANLSDRCVPWNPTQSRGDPEIGCLLETSVTELHLKRSNQSDTSYRLHIEARFRLLRRADQAVLTDATLTYDTPPALYLDWAMNEGAPFEKCVMTGYRQMARQFLTDLATRSGETTIRIGHARPAAPTTTTAPRATRAVVRLVNHPVPAPAVVQRVSLPMSAPSPVYIVPSPTPDFFRLTQPPQPLDATSTAVAEIDRAGIEAMQHPNTVVALGGIAVLAPISLYHQTIGSCLACLRIQTSPETIQTMRDAIRDWRPARELATSLARDLERSDVRHVVLRLTPDASSSLAGELSPTPRVLPATHQPQPKFDPEASARLVQIEIVRASLSPRNWRQTRFAVLLEARVRVFDVATGTQLHTSTVNYESPSRSYQTWAAKDAAQFRTELANARETLSRTTTNELLVRGWLNPQPSLPTLAGEP